MTWLVLIVCLVPLTVVADYNPWPRTGRCITNSSGQTVCPPPGGTCLKNLEGKIVCSPPDGGIVRDLHGNFLCGPGQCVKNYAGQAFCSLLPRGAATVDVYGKFVCSGGCVPASPLACWYPR